MQNMLSSFNSSVRGRGKSGIKLIYIDGGLFGRWRVKLAKSNVSDDMKQNCCYFNTNVLSKPREGGQKVEGPEPLVTLSMLT